MTDAPALPLGPPHLIPERSDRGFAHYPPLLPADARAGTADARAGTLEVYESSSAEGPHLWLGFGGDPYHVTAEHAWKFAEQIRQAVAGHYQGDARPDWARERPKAGDWVRYSGPLRRVDETKRPHDVTNPFLESGTLYRLDSIEEPEAPGDAALPILATPSGEILAVEPGEVELVWRP